MAFIYLLYYVICLLGHIDLKEFMQSLQDLGVHISPQHAEKALKRYFINLFNSPWSWVVCLNVKSNNFEFYV